MSKCLKCGKKLVQLPGKRAKSYCNSTCRSGNWHISHRAAEKVKEEKPKKKKAAGTKVISVTKKKIVSDGASFIDPNKPTLKQIKDSCPASLKGIDRSLWISEKRQSLGV